MKQLLFHPRTAAALADYISRPAQALLMVGAKGIGKSAAARYTAAGILDIAVDKITEHPYVRILLPVDGKQIPIEAVRELQHFLSLRIPRNGGVEGPEPISRIVIIEEAGMLTTEAQNALLKTLEEPPVDTAFILTAPSAESVLPTVQSRVSVLHIVVPALAELREYLAAAGYPAKDTGQALMVSGGLPGLSMTLLDSSDEHPLYQATDQARHLLRGSAYDRLLLVETLSKQKQLAIDVVFILGQMARMALINQGPSGSKASQRWQNILKATYDADVAIRRNTGMKLVLTNLMLEL